MPTIANDLLVDVFIRARDALVGVVTGLSPEQLTWRPDPQANPVGWIAWHLARVQDDHMADLGDVEQAWTADGWFARFGLSYAVAAHGYGHSSEQVGAWHGDAELLVGYHRDVTDRTLEVVRGMDDAAYGRVVDRRWDPPVTAAVRLVSVVAEVNQHLGQAAYVKGLLGRA